MREESGIAAGLTSLPECGGVSALGDRFQPDLVRGSGGYSMNINCPKGPNELQPSLSLSYSTGSGNGPFGLGWRLNILRIERRSDRGVPNYTGDDTFVIGDAEILVPIGDNRYRPKCDTKSWKIENLGESWQIQTGDGKTMRFGQSNASREAEGTRIFAWYLDEEIDAAGNSIFYFYKMDKSRLYLQEVKYSIFRILFIYEDRPDQIRNGRSAFSRITALRASKIELHCDPAAQTLMRTYQLSYRKAQNGISLLERFSLSASDGIKTDHAPDLTFDYSAIDFTVWNVHEIQSMIVPPGLENSGTQLVDMTGNGLPDVIQSVGARMLLWRNHGEGYLTGPTQLDAVPSTISLARDNVALADLNGDGRVDLFAVDQPLQLAFVANGRGGFQADPIVFRDRPNLRLSSPDTRLLDIDGDGVTDLISTGRDHFLLFRHETGQGWQEPYTVARVEDLDQFPDVTFQDRGTLLADMTGDGLQDFLLVRSGDVSYWPYFGNGVWGNRVSMEHPPQFPPGYRDNRLHVVDLDGDGCSDVIYFDYDRTVIWLNQSGVSFAPAIEIPIAPNPGSTHFLPADFWGDDRIGFLWTAVGSGDYSAGYRFLRFDGGRKPNLLTNIQNGMGRQTTIEYATTTVMRLADEANGEDWRGQLPFVVPVVSAIRDLDTISGIETQVSIHYHDGVYDGPEREFRGFTRTTVETAGDKFIPTLRQEYRFFQGDPDEFDLVARERQRALAGSIQSLNTFEQAGDDFVLRQESMQTWDARSEFDNAISQVYFPFLVQIENREHSTTGAPKRIELTRLLDYDAHGNAQMRIREFFAEGDQVEPMIRTEERFVYTKNENPWLVKLPVRSELRDEAGLPFSITIYNYDGPDFEGLPEGQINRGLLIRKQELVLLESRLPQDYWGNRDFSTLGYELTGADDTRGYYATTQSVRRDNKGNIIEQRDPLGALSKTTYDGDGIYPIERTDELGKVAQITFDLKFGEPSFAVLPDGRHYRFQRDLLGRLIAQFEKDDAGQEQLKRCWRLDTGSIPVSVTSFTPEKENREAVEFLLAEDLTQLLQVSISRVYLDGFGKQILKIDTAADGPDGIHRYVASGQTLTTARKMVAAEFPSVFVPGFAFISLPELVTARVHHRYDAQGNLIETVGPGPAHFRVVRDNFTLQHFEGPSAGGFGAAVPPGPPTRIEFFDSRDRVVRIEEAKGDGTAIATSYDLTIDGRIAAVRNHFGDELVRYTFAGTGEAVRIIHRDAGSRTYYRDAAGRIVELIRADGSRLFYRYDAAGRLLRIEYTLSKVAVPTVVREMFYDIDPGAPSVGRFLATRIALVRDAGNEIRYSYNRAGSKVREEVTVAGATMATAWEYNLRQEVTALIYPDAHRLEYFLDASGSIQQISDILTQVSYTAEGYIDGYTSANGVQSRFLRDPISRRLNHVSATRPGNSLRSMFYTYDDIGNIIGLQDEITGAVEHQTFAYDGLYRLTHFESRQNDEVGPVLRSEAYDYDPEGNLRHIGTKALVYGDAIHSGRLTTVINEGISQAIDYDDNGSVLAWGELTAIEYDAFDRIVQVKRADGVQLRFAYDPQNRRVLKQVITGQQTASVQYPSPFYERHDTHAIRNIYLGSILIASETVNVAGTGAIFFLSDHHGTILLATNDEGAIVQNQRYMPFGLALKTDIPPDRYLGIEQDSELGLLPLGARYYAPGIGRFISPDWYILENPTKPMRIPQGFNAYSYALNNPLMFKDITGKWFFLIPFAVGFIAGLVYGLADGQGWDAFGTAFETGLTTGFGALLGGVAAGSIGGVMGGINGLFTGLRKTYDWGNVEGWASFISDSTWGIIGTSLGNILNIVNLIEAPSGYDSGLSKRQNRQVYNRGFNLTSGDTAFTQGNVISNLDRGNPGQGRNPNNSVLRHERTHILQSRLFGPLYIGSSVAWYVVTAIMSPFVALAEKNSIGDELTILGHDDNPWELWAGAHDPPGG